MEGNKKENNEEKVKIYDKDMYISQEKLRTIILIILTFIIGFLAGYLSGNLTNTNEGKANQAQQNIENSNQNENSLE